tara:strand:- start:2936 stop:3214 length:279 start_codon:yes stop_codon:yes gene_type:complete
MCTEQYKNAVNLEFIQGYLDSAWPMNSSGGDVQSSDKSKDGEVGDVAAITFIVEGSDTTLAHETKLYIRNPAGIGSSTFLWSEYAPTESQDN